MKFSTKELVLQAMIASMYVVITFLFQSVSFGAEQFRAAEFLLILVLVHPKNMVGIILGTLIANLFSTVGIVDVAVGTFATYLALVLMTKLKGKWLKYLMPAVVNGVIIAIMLNVVFDLPLVITMFTVFGSELIVTMVPWLIIGDKLIENPKIKEIFG
ncbi:MAG: QueT transporter family protein [Erysipelothrix sp.]|nr:QueT transporter family protein [Erysipelothrix sp.]